MANGYLDSQNIDFATGQTESRLRNMQNRLGINFTEFIARVDAAITALNAPGGLVSELCYRTSEDRKTGAYGGSKVFRRAAEYSPERPQKGEGSGWLLPLYENEIALGFTRKALDVMQVSTFEGELATTMQAIERGQRADVLTRLFSDAELGLDNDGVGATPGFAGSGTGSNVYSGPVPPGVGTLNMYQRVASTGLAGAVDSAVKWLQFFHGMGPFDLIGSASAIDLIMALPKFTKAGDLLVRAGSGTAEAVVDATKYVGVLNGNIRVRLPEAQLSGDGVAIYKSYGNDNLENPLAWRYSDIWGPNAWVEDRELYPLANALVKQNFGVGVNHRAGAALIAVAASGTYAAAAPTVSR
ncbi:MAG: hypothetical protein WBA46_15865 [Thermomicrobiales bacterium]